MLFLKNQLNLIMPLLFVFWFVLSSFFSVAMFGMLRAKVTKCAVHTYCMSHLMKFSASPMGVNAKLGINHISAIPMEA
jgi:hypothetical protein